MGERVSQEALSFRSVPRLTPGIEANNKVERFHTEEAPFSDGASSLLELHFTYALLYGPSGITQMRASGP